jgi:tetratricopeptide (TPR) repeat protein
LTLNEQKFKKEKCGLVTTVKPETASLYINDVLIENISGNGLYQLYLPKGNYFCRIEQKGYRPIVQAITIGKGTQNLNIELESVMAELEVKCKTSTAEIFVDGEKKGNGSWKGTILAGEHQIEARQQNHESNSQNISIAEKEIRTLVIPELKRSMGKVKIVTNPSGMPVIVDGKDVGISPCVIEVESGKHYVSCKSYGVEPIRSNIEVNGGNIINVELQIQYADDVWKDYYERAYNGSLKDVLSLACLGGIKGNYQEAVFWINRHPQGDKAVKYWQEYGGQTDLAYWKCDWIQIYCEVGNPEKALDIYSIWQQKELDNGGMGLLGLEIMYIGDAFLKKKDLDKAIQCYEKAGKDGYEGLGDCYTAKGNKQLAASYYRKCLSKEYVDNRNRVEKKLKELGY